MIYHLIVNEESGVKRGGKSLKKIEKYLNDNKIEYVTHSTEKQGDGIAIARGLTGKGEEVNIIAVGGDGTFHEVVNGIEDFDKTTVGFIPAGRGNDFARSAGLSLNPVKTLQKILENNTSYIDYIDISGKRSLNFAGTGLDIEVLERVLKKKRSGKLSYVMSLIACLTKFEPYKIEVTCNGETYEREVIMVGVGNGGYFGGGIRISPLSKVNDGKMDLIIINMVKRAKIPFIFMSFLKGRHIMPKIKKYAEHIICDAVKIINRNEYKLQLDGEIYEKLTFDAELIKGRLRVFNVNQ